MMDTMRILLANEPLAYREVIAAALLALRPQHEVFIVAPEELDSEVTRLAPQMVVCSRFSAVVQAIALAWVMLYPDGASHAVVSIAGASRTVGDIEFNSILSIVDHTEQLAEPG